MKNRADLRRFEQRSKQIQSSVKFMTARMKAMVDRHDSLKQSPTPVKKP